MNLFQSIQQAQQELANVVPATPLTENLNLSENLELLFYLKEKTFKWCVLIKLEAHTTK